MLSRASAARRGASRAGAADGMASTEMESTRSAERTRFRPSARTMLQLVTRADQRLVIPAAQCAGVGLRQKLQPPETLVAGRCATVAGDGYLGRAA